ncbi:MAG: hypothetical protein R2856_06765 [Caldilineaceae bacterium]
MVDGMLRQAHVFAQSTGGRTGDGFQRSRASEGSRSWPRIPRSTSTIPRRIKR